MADVYLEVHNVYPVRGSVLRTKKEVGGMDHIVEQKNKKIKNVSKRNFPDQLVFTRFHEDRFVYQNVYLEVHVSLG